MAPTPTNNSTQAPSQHQRVDQYPFERLFQIAIIITVLALLSLLVGFSIASYIIQVFFKNYALAEEIYSPIRGVLLEIRRDWIILIAIAIIYFSQQIREIIRRIKKVGPAGIVLFPDELLDIEKKQIEQL